MTLRFPLCGAARALRLRTLWTTALVLVLALLGACNSGDSEVEGGQPTTTSAPSGVSTRPSSAPTSVATTLPPDSRPRTPPVDATDDLAGVGTHRSLDDLVAEIVKIVENRSPAGEGSRMSSSTSVTTTNSTGTVVVRRDGFADDSVAGEEFVVSIEEGPGGWRVVSATRSAICYRGVNGELCV